jgi:hypothetical protein
MLPSALNDQIRLEEHGSSYLRNADAARRTGSPVCCDLKSNSALRVELRDRQGKELALHKAIR